MSETFANLPIEMKSPHSQSEGHVNVAELVKNNFSRVRNELIASLGIIIADLTVPHNLDAMKAGASLGERALVEIPSTFDPAHVSDAISDKPLPGFDAAFDIATVSGSIALASKTTSTKELAVMAGVAETAATAADWLVAHEGVMSSTEKMQPDNGTSAVMVAFIFKYLHDRLSQAETKREKIALKVIIGTFLGAVTVGAAYMDSKNASTDFTSHLSGAAVGYGASKISSTEAATNNSEEPARKRRLLQGIHFLRKKRRTDQESEPALHL